MAEQNIRLLLRSEISDDESGERECDERSLPGVLRKRGDSILLTYAEDSEGGEIRSELLCTEDRIRLRRRGAIRSEILFSEGVVHRSLYEIPPYRFDMTVTTEGMRYVFDGAAGEIDLVYRTEIGSAPRHCRLTLSVTPDDR